DNTPLPARSTADFPAKSTSNAGSLPATALLLRESAATILLPTTGFPPPETPDRSPPPPHPRPNEAAPIANPCANTAHPAPPQKAAPFPAALPPAHRSDRSALPN